MNSYRDAQQLFSNTDYEISHFIKHLGIRKSESVLRKVQSIIEQSRLETLNSNNIGLIKNLVNDIIDSETFIKLEQIRQCSNYANDLIPIMNERDIQHNVRRYNPIKDLVFHFKNGRYDPPVLLITPNGFYVVSGRTRLMIAWALNKPIAVKVLNKKSFRKLIVKESEENNYVDDLHQTSMSSM